MKVTSEKKRRGLCLAVALAIGLLTTACGSSDDGIGTAGVDSGAAAGATSPTGTSTAGAAGSGSAMAGAGGSSSGNDASAGRAGSDGTKVDAGNATPDTPSAKDIVDTAIAAGTFKTLVAAVQAAGLEATLRSPGPFTVFAPTDTAFAALGEAKIADLLKPANKELLTKILTYHVVSGKVLAADVVKLTSAKTVEGESIKITVKDGKVILNDKVNVTATDVLASNGVIHVIDAVLIPPSLATPPPPPAKDIVDTAIAAGTFKTLVAAVQAAGLEATLRSPGPFTVFAPTDTAFAALGEATIAELLKPANKELLTKILTYHVVSGKVLAADVVKLTSAKTVEGESIKITVKDGKVILNDKVNVTATDVLASNGVIHVIDAVLVPPSLH